MSLDLVEWEANETFLEAKSLRSSLAVVNDSAEHAVALSQRYNDFATKNEKQKRAILANVFDNRKENSKLFKSIHCQTARLEDYFCYFIIFFKLSFLITFVNVIAQHRRTTQLLKITFFIVY